MKVDHVDVYKEEGETASFDSSEHRELHLLFRDGMAIVNYQEGKEQISHAYPTCKVELQYTKPAVMK